MKPNVDKVVYSKCQNTSLSTHSWEGGLCLIEHLKLSQDIAIVQAVSTAGNQQRSSQSSFLLRIPLEVNESSDDLAGY